MKTIQSITHKNFNNFINANNILIKNSSILASISGGQDSMCLLKLLKDYQQYKQWNIHIVHFNHGWRQDSNDNASFIENIANRWSFILHKKKAKIIFSEQKARAWRYAKMHELCEEFEIKYVVTGHTYNDKLETILLNMLKGSGIEGIQTIQPWINFSNQVKIIHPLIHIKRKETAWFCRKFQMPIWCDTTNYNKSITRNRIREEIIPYCKKYFNSNVEGSIYNFMENINYDLDYLQQRTYYLYYKYKHPKFVGINKSVFSFFPLSLQRRIIRIFIYHNTEIKLNFSETKRCIILVNSNKIQITQISKLWYLYITDNWIYLLSSGKYKIY